MLKNPSLKYRLILGGISAVIIPFTIAGAIIYIQLSNSLLEMTQEKSVHFAKDLADLIDATLKQEIKLAQSIAGDPDIVAASKSGKYQDAQLELVGIYNSIGRDFFTLFLTDGQGINRADALFSEQIGLDLSDRDYFLSAKNGKTGIIGPFLPRGTATPGESIIVVYAPIQDSGNFYGAVVIAFDTQFITDILSQKKIGKTGFAFVINSDGLMLAHPEKKYNLTLRLLDRPGLEQMRGLVQSGATGSVAYTFNATKKIAGLKDMALTGWWVVFSQDWDEIMLPVNRLLLTIFISGFIFLVITIAAIILFSGRISTPIQNVLETMRQVTQHSTEIILQIGTDRKIVFANPAFQSISGLKSEEIIGTEPDFSIPDDISPAVVWRSLENGNTWSGYITLKGKGAGPTTLDVIFIPVEDDKGAIEGYLEIGRDISDKLLFEKRMRQAQKLEAIGTLAGGIAHDFNNILGGIFGFAELSLQDDTSDLKKKKYMREIVKASERARDLVSQILTFSRRANVQLRPLLPETIVKEVVKLLRASIPNTIDIQSDIKSSSHIMAEPTQIHQILMNLFTNAVHAIGDGPGTIRLEISDYMVDEDFTKIHPDIRQGKHIMLRISDTGKGIEQKVLDQIFEPFFTTKPQGEGTGLGLSVVHGIVKKLGGTITVYSEIGKGTVFNIVIPIVDPADIEKQQNILPLRKGTERVVIIDDETAITVTMKSILTNLGYNVTAFSDAEAALAAIKNNPDSFDVIITDYSMPQITGLEIAGTLKEAGIRIPIILASGFIEKKMENAARRAGISLVIAKPLNAYQITDAIRRVKEGEGPAQDSTTE